jgi:hypothetical protein
MQEELERYDVIFRAMGHLLYIAMEQGKAAVDQVIESSSMDWLSDKKLRVQFAEEINSIYAYGVCLNGFSVKPDGMITPDHSGLYFQRDPEGLAKSISFLMKAGFLDNRGTHSH